MTTPTPKMQINGVQRYQAMFDGLKNTGKQTALIPFTLLGYPNKTLSLDIIKTMIDSGASALELGLAFSDPMADGPVLQKASSDVLATGFGVGDAIEQLKAVRAYDAHIPIGLLVYYNIVLAYGLQAWFETLCAIGVDAVMIVDLPLESLDEVQTLAEKYNVQLVLMVSPLSNEARIRDIAARKPAFFYVVSRLGITGAHATYDQQLQAMLDQIHSVSDIPACVGFGISKPSDVTGMKALGADGVIVGSAIIQTVSQAVATQSDPLKALQDYLKTLSLACRDE
ncbi:MAG: tryptophan synthase subunit alpha [Vampirovibrionales bacterium]|nr:tryptophan synthase subunit alpha [Vampirovibrionales bacterium]